MTIAGALAEINTFWTDSALPFGQTDNSAQLLRLESEFKQQLPPELREYVRAYAPAEACYFEAVGNPMEVYAADQLRAAQPGYAYDGRSGEAVADWNPHFFLLGDMGANPILLDLTQPQQGVQLLLHGAGSWEYGSIIAGTIGQFLLCCALRHHALVDITDEPITDDERGFRLVDEVAQWYFPRLRRWAGDYYEEWAGDFDNH